MARRLYVTELVGALQVAAGYFKLWVGTAVEVVLVCKPGQWKLVASGNKAELVEDKVGVYASALLHKDSNLRDLAVQLLTEAAERYWKGSAR